MEIFYFNLFEQFPEVPFIHADDPGRWVCCNIQMSNYNFSLTTFSSTGKLTQIEYALNAVLQGVTSIGLKGNILTLLCLSFMC